MSNIYANLNNEEDEVVSNGKLCFCGIGARVRVSRIRRNPLRRFCGCGRYVVRLFAVINFGFGCSEIFEF